MKKRECKLSKSSRVRAFGKKRQRWSKRHKRRGEGKRKKTKLTKRSKENLLNLLLFDGCVKLKKSSIKVKNDKLRHIRKSRGGGQSSKLFEINFRFQRNMR